ncbi:uncharacterized protein LOC135193050 isoform X6 [Pogoniulus pusillus]|uniref:uncharacterized protein LOC135193050 isoform X6 n=1 Tax=Pogoniulus pusillus TaxID=488313 RepID=UPI0030B97426
MAASTERQAGGQGVSGQREASRVPRQSCVLCLSQQRSLGSSMPQDWDSGLILKVTIKLSPEFMESVCGLPVIFIYLVNLVLQKTKMLKIHQ